MRSFRVASPKHCDPALTCGSSSRVTWAQEMKSVRSGNPVTVSPSETSSVSTPATAVKLNDCSRSRGCPAPGRSGRRTGCKGPGAARQRRSNPGVASVSVKPDLAGQTVVVIGGSSGIGLETARLARDEGAQVILTARDAERLKRVGQEIGASTVAFDATGFEQLGRFFKQLPDPIDHVLVTGPGPYYAPLAEFDFEKARRDVESHLLLPLQVARSAVGKVRPGGTLLFMGGTGGRRAAPGLALISALTAAGPALTKNLALELAPIRVNLIAAGFVDTPLSAAILGDELERRREQLRKTLPIRRVVEPADIAALAVHLMTNTGVTGATFDIDGGQQLVEG